VPPRKIPVKRLMVRMGADGMRRDEREDFVEGCVKVIEYRGPIIGMLLFVLRRHFDFGRVKREARTICEKEEQGDRGAAVGDRCEEDAQHLPKERRGKPDFVFQDFSVDVRWLRRFGPVHRNIPMLRCKIRQSHDPPKRVTDRSHEDRFA